jgi:hypothetical protein
MSCSKVALATVLAGLEGLESLSVDKQESTDPVSVKVPNCWTAAKWASASSLRRLVLKTHMFTREDALFVAHFPNLEALSLSLSNTSVDFPVADKQKPLLGVFPSIKFLTRSMPPGLLLPFRSSFTASLVTLHLRLGAGAPYWTS